MTATNNRAPGTGQSLSQDGLAQAKADLLQAYHEQLDPTQKEEVDLEKIKAGMVKYYAYVFKCVRTPDHGGPPGWDSLFDDLEQQFPDYNFNSFPDNLSEEEIYECLVWLGAIPDDNEMHEDGKMGRKEWVSLPYPDPCYLGQTGWSDPGSDVNNNGPLVSTAMFLPSGPPQTRDNTSHNPDRRPYMSHQCSSYSGEPVNDPFNFYFTKRGKVDHKSNWQSGPPENDVIFDHVVDNAGYWSTAGGPFSNWRNSPHDDHTGASSGKPYYPALMEAVTKHGGNKMLYNFGHGTSKSTPEGGDFNVIGASGYLSPIADMHENSKEISDDDKDVLVKDIFASMNVAHFYNMYRTDITNGELDELDEIIDEIDTITPEIARLFGPDGKDPFFMDTDKRAQKFLKRKIKNTKAAGEAIRIVAMHIADVKKKKAPDCSRLLELLHNDELTWSDCMHWYWLNNSDRKYVPTYEDMAEFIGKGYTLADYYGKKVNWRWGWKRGLEPNVIADIMQMHPFSKYKKKGKPVGFGTATYSSNKPGKPGGNNGGGNNNIGGGNNNKPGFKPGGGIDTGSGGATFKSMWKTYKKWHDQTHPTCKGPPCQHIGNGPHNGINPNGGTRYTWMEAMWEAHHAANYPKCRGTYMGTRRPGGVWCEHQPGGNKFNGFDDLDFEDIKANEKVWKSYWTRYHQHAFPGCKGKWQRNLDPVKGFPDSDGYCIHHPFYPHDDGLNAHDNIQNNKDELNPDDYPDDWQWILQHDRDENGNLININWADQEENHRPNLNVNDIPEGGIHIPSTDDQNGRPILNHLDPADFPILGPDSPGGRPNRPEYRPERPERPDRDPDQPILNPNLDIEVDPDNPILNPDAEIPPILTPDWRPDKDNPILNPDRDPLFDLPNYDPNNPIINPDLNLDPNSQRPDPNDPNYDPNRREYYLAYRPPYGWVLVDRDGNVVTDEGGNVLGPDGQPILNPDRPGAGDDESNIPPILDPDWTPDDDREPILNPDAWPDAERPERPGTGDGRFPDWERPNRAERPDRTHEGVSITVDEDGAPNITVRNYDPGSGGLSDEDIEYLDGYGIQVFPADDGDLVIRLDPDRDRGDLGSRLPPNGINIGPDINIIGDGGTGVNINVSGPNPNLPTDEDNIHPLWEDMWWRGDGHIDEDGHVHLDYDRVHIDAHENGTSINIEPRPDYDNAGPDFEIILQDQNGDQITITPNENGDWTMNGEEITDEDRDRFGENWDEFVDQLREDLDIPPPDLNDHPLVSEIADALLWEIVDQLIENDKIQTIADIGRALDAVRRALDFMGRIEFIFSTFGGEVGAIVAAFYTLSKGIALYVRAILGEVKQPDFICELVVPMPGDECSHFPNRERNEADMAWTSSKEIYMNKRITTTDIGVVQLYKLRHNGYLVDCSTVAKKSGLFGTVSRVAVHYLTPTYSIGLNEGDKDYKYFSVCPKEYPDPCRADHIGGDYNQSPRESTFTSMRRMRQHIENQDGWGELAALHQSYWRPMFHTAVKGPTKQYNYRTYGGNIIKTGTCEEVWGEVWRISGRFESQEVPGCYMDNIFTEQGHGFIVNCNYQSDDSSHASIYEINTADPKPWPWEIGKNCSPKVTMDMEQIRLATSKLNLAKAWQLAHIQMNFVDLKNPDNVFHIELDNKETRWVNRAKNNEAIGYRLRGLNENPDRADYYMAQLHDIPMEEWLLNSDGKGDNTFQARCPLHLAPKYTWNDGKFATIPWDQWGFVGFTYVVWPDNHNHYSGGTAAGKVSVRPKCALFKRLRFVKEFPTDYMTDMWTREIMLNPDAY